MLRIRNLPWVVRLPLLAAVMIFTVAVGTSQIAMHWMFHRQEQQALAMTAAYMDGLAAAVQTYAETGDLNRLRATAFRMLDAHGGVDALRLAVLAPDGRVLVTAAEPAIGELAPPANLVPGSSQWLFDATGGTAWLARPLGEENAGSLAVQVDFSELEIEQRSLHFALLWLDLALSALCALIGYWAMKRMLGPVTDLTGRIERAQEAMPSPVPDEALPPPETEFGRLVRGFNRMVAAAREREGLAATLAEQDKAAVLGRLAATVAHEVRNPLGGLVNTVDTLKRFGHEPAVREQSLSILERGLASIGEVVHAVLATYRAPERPRALTDADLADLRLLTEPEARRRNITLDWTVEMPAEVPVDATRTRQIVLNLLLNACAATPPGGRVRFSAAVDDGALMMNIADEGPGMPAIVAARLKDGGSKDAGGAPGGGMGVAVVVRLVEALQGRVSVRSEPGAGTEIVLTLPFTMAGEPV